MFHKHCAPPVIYIVDLFFFEIWVIHVQNLNTETQPYHPTQLALVESTSTIDLQSTFIRTIKQWDL